MSSVTRSVCDACGVVAEPAKVSIATFEGDSDVGEVQSREYSPKLFQCADGSTRKLPRGWWIFELTSYADEHVVAELCPGCAETFGKYVKRKSKKLAEQARAALEAPGEPELRKLPGAKAPKSKRA